MAESLLAPRRRADWFEPNGVKCRSCGARIEWWYSGCPNRLAVNGKCRDTRMQVAP